MGASDLYPVNLGSAGAPPRWDRWICGRRTFLSSLHGQLLSLHDQDQFRKLTVSQISNLMAVLSSRLTVCVRKAAENQLCPIEYTQEYLAAYHLYEGAEGT